MVSDGQEGNQEIRSEAELRARFKDAARDSRLSFKNRTEDLLRRDLKEKAMAICKPQVADFAKCAEKEGLLVVFRCQSLLKELNQCLSVHNGEEAWQKYKEQHKELLERRAKGIIN